MWKQLDRNGGIRSRKRKAQFGVRLSLLGRIRIHPDCVRSWNRPKEMAAGVVDVRSGRTPVLKVRFLGRGGIPRRLLPSSRSDPVLSSTNSLRSMNLSPSESTSQIIDRTSSLETLCPRLDMIDRSFKDEILPSPFTSNLSKTSINSSIFW